MTPSDREAAIRVAFLGVAAELAALEPSKSGSVTIHFQNGIPMKHEWHLLARTLNLVRVSTVDYSEQEG